MPASTSTADVRTHTGRRGFSLIDVLVGAALMLIVFTSIIMLFRIGMELLLNSKARIGALALATETIEYVRSLDYNDVGTVSGIPPGILPQTEVVTRNGITYTRRILVQYIDSPVDGTGVSDDNGIPADYKVVKTELTWPFRNETRSYSFVTSVTPPGMETIAGGGTLILNIFNSVGVPIDSAEVRIVNDAVIPPVDVNVFSNASGRVVFPGSPANSNYEITITKPGYTTARTYAATTSNPNPNPGHLSVLEGETTVASFQIDLASTKIVRTYQMYDEMTWDDSFDDWLMVATSASSTIVGGSLVLEDLGGGSYASSGMAQMEAASDPELEVWHRFGWSDTVTATTSVRYRVLHIDAGSWVVVPDSDLPGNEAGFTVSPVDLTGLSTTTYPMIRIAAYLETEDADYTPSVDNWSVDYRTGPIPLGNVSFNMVGTKNSGTDGLGQPILKYDEDHETDVTGAVTLSDLEWDTYTITIDPLENKHVAEVCSPQPLGLNPGVATTTWFILASSSPHALHVLVRDGASSALINDALVHVHRTGYDTFVETSPCGQAYIGGMVEASYTVDVGVLGYATTTVSGVAVSGYTSVTVNMN